MGPYTPLDLKIMELSLLVRVIRDGWNENKIFADPDSITNRYGSYPVKLGWETVLRNADDSICGKRISWGQNGVCPTSIAEFIAEAEEFFKIISLKT